MFRVTVSGPREQEASFFTVVVWRDQAEHVGQSLTKGSRVVVVGRLQHRRLDEESSIVVDLSGGWCGTFLLRTGRSSWSGEVSEMGRDPPPVVEWVDEAAATIAPGLIGRGQDRGCARG